VTWSGDTAHLWDTYGFFREIKKRTNANHSDFKYDNKKGLPDLILLLCKITEVAQPVVKTE
jgi:hypothetical protein